jgi:hypothetical protein
MCLLPLVVFVLFWVAADGWYVTRHAACRCGRCGRLKPPSGQAPNPGNPGLFFTCLLFLAALAAPRRQGVHLSPPESRREVGVGADGDELLRG